MQWKFSENFVTGSGPEMLFLSVQAIFSYMRMTNKLIVQLFDENFYKKNYQCCVHTNIFYQKRKNLNMISVKLSWTSNDLKLIETFSSQIQNTFNVILFEIQTLFALQIISEGPCTIFITVIQSIHDVTRAQHNSKTRYKQYTATQVQKRS